MKLAWQRTSKTAELWFADPGRGPHYVIRLGRPKWRQFTERYQGQHGIPIRWHYYLNGYISTLDQRDKRHERNGA